MPIPILGDIISAVAQVADKAIVDVDKKKEIMLELEQLHDQADVRTHEELMGQIDVDKVEAANPSVFVAGWRPFVGWVGGVGLAYSVFVEPFMEFVSKTIFHYAGSFPVINTEVLLQVLMGMLGFGLMRSYEKTKGVETSAVGNPPPVAAPTDPPPKKHFHIF